MTGWLLDSDCAIHLRDGDPGIKALVGGMDRLPSMSIVTRIELEGGVRAKPEFAEKRRASLDAMLATFPVLDFTDAEADAYRALRDATGFSRRKVADRMIAATAIVHDLTLITANGADYADIPGLKLEVWKAGGR